MTHRNFYSFALAPMDWAVDPPTKSALQVWMVLHDHRDQSGHSYVSHSEIMEITSLSRTALKKAVSWLVDRDYVKALKGSGRDVTRYRLIWHSEKRPELYYKKLKSLEGPKSDPLRATNVTARGSQMKPSHLLINKTSSKEDVKDIREVRVAEFSDLFVEIAQEASAWASGLPGVNPPTPRSIRAAHSDTLMKIWNDCSQDREELLEFFKRCYARPWHRGVVTKGSKQWFPQSFTWFLKEWESLRDIDWTAQELAEDCFTIEENNMRSRRVL